ncbi:enoyl-CoA-hydratase DpgB [Streptomyces sp. NPDC088194]|uniref:enoyl-CoA-hydratase DpgB n=1 Tax=Streptomyces sp. NPDC088194 TaxID=3154931 RepID=UPI00344D5E46
MSAYRLLEGTDMYEHDTSSRHEHAERVLRIGAGHPLPVLTDAVREVCEQAEADRRCLVLRLVDGGTPGEGWPGDVTIQEVNRWERAVRRLERLPAVTIAVAEGTCAGAAFDLLLATDYRIAGADLRLRLPVNAGQLWPGTAVFRLAQQVSPAHARQLVLWRHELSARQALDAGVVDECRADTDAAVRAAVVLLGELAGAEVAVRRQLIREAASSPYEDALGAHLSACDRELRRLGRRRPVTPLPPTGGGR